MNWNIKEKPPPTLRDTHLFKFLYLISQSINNSHKAPRKHWISNLSENILMHIVALSNLCSLDKHSSFYSHYKPCSGNGQICGLTSPEESDHYSSTRLHWTSPPQELSVLDWHLSTVLFQKRSPADWFQEV